MRNRTQEMDTKIYKMSGMTSARK